MLLGFRVLARPAGKPAKAVVAVRDQRAHPEFSGEGHGLVVVACGRLDVGWIGVGRDLTAEPEGVGFVTAFTTLAGQRESTTCDGDRLFELVGEHTHFA